MGTRHVSSVTGQKESDSAEFTMCSKTSGPSLKLICPRFGCASFGNKICVANREGTVECFDPNTMGCDQQLAPNKPGLVFELIECNRLRTLWRQDRLRPMSRPIWVRIDKKATLLLAMISSSGRSPLHSISSNTSLESSPWLVERKAH